MRPQDNSNSDSNNAANKHTLGADQHKRQNPSKAPVGGNAFTEFIGKALLKLSGWSVEGEMPQHSKMVFAIGPHTSNWDFFLGVAVLFALRIRIRFLGKHTIFIPIFKPFLEAIGGMPVDRKANKGIVAQVVDEFNSQPEMILALAPEGTRSVIYPWKTGFLAIAHKAQAHVALIGFDFARKKVQFGPVFLTQGSLDADIHADMLKVYEYFGSIRAKYPHKTQTQEQ